MPDNVETIAYEFVDRSNSEEFTVPWHGRGIPVDPNTDLDQMQAAAGLDWRVFKAKHYVDIEGKKKYTGMSSLIRDSDKSILGSVSNDWEYVQNSEMFEFIDKARTVVRDRGSDLIVNTAGSLNNGKDVWVLARIQDSFFNPVAGDEVHGYLLFSNPHRYGRCLDIRFTPIRVVCSNTLTLALSGKSDLAVRANHRKKFDPDFVLKTLGLAENNMKTYQEAAEVLTNVQFTDKSLQKYFAAVFPPHDRKKNKEELSRPAKHALAAVETQPGAQFAKGSWWQAFNAATYVVDHVMGRSVDARLTSAWYGPNRAKKVTALKKAIEFANAA